MYYQLTGALKRRFIKELRKYWMYHPQYRDIVDNIQGKYRFKERPQYGMVIRTAGGSKADLSADNFKGVLHSYVYLAKYRNYPGVAIEWVREDGIAIQNAGGRFPSLPGAYYIELTENDQFYVDPLLDVYREQVTMSDSTTGMLQRPPLDGTVRLFEMPSGFLLEEGIGYALARDAQGNPTGEFTLTQGLTGGRYLSADYRYPAATTGPHTIYPMQANNQAIPGVVLAFGSRVEKGDRMAVIVQDVRRPAALVYGGQWEINLEFEVICRDLDAQMEIADQTAIYIWGILRSYLSTEGIEITEFSLGGESEEVYDENGDDYFYNATMSATVKTDWEVHVPLNIFIRQAAVLTKEQAQVLAQLPDDQLAYFQTNLHLVENLGLEHIRDPFFTNRSHTFEVIR